VEALKATAPRTNNETTSFFMESFPQVCGRGAGRPLHRYRLRYLIKREAWLKVTELFRAF
jgi:hypothetical protein